MSIKSFIAVLDEVASYKPEDCNIFSITAIIIARFCSVAKSVTWKEIAVAHNATCHKSMRVSELSSGAGGYNFRNELFNIQHDSSHELAGVVLFTTDANKKIHSSDKKRRNTLTGMKLQAAASRALGTRKSKLARFYKK